MPPPLVWPLQHLSVLPSSAHHRQSVCLLLLPILERKHEQAFLWGRRMETGLHVLHNIINDLEITEKKKDISFNSNSKSQASVSFIGHWRMMLTGWQSNYPWPIIITALTQISTISDFLSVSCETKDKPTIGHKLHHDVGVGSLCPDKCQAAGSGPNTKSWLDQWVHCVAR